MLIFARLGAGLLQLLIFLLEIYTWAIIASALISWIFLPPTNPVVRFLRFITEPVLAPCRQILYRVLPAAWRRIDFSPILALLFIRLIIFILNLVMIAVR